MWLARVVSVQCFREFALRRKDIANLVCNILGDQLERIRLNESEAPSLPPQS